jgi:radical SAM superfamily enzyme YgiQ (UPF0313 family)
VGSVRNILLISANNFCTPYPVYPIGISYLYTYIKNKFPDHNISFFDFNNQTISSLTDLISGDAYDLIGLSLRNIDDTNIYSQNSFIAWYKEIVEAIKKVSSARIILGGPAFSLFPEQMFDTLNPDFGIKGEGEESFAQLIECIDKDLDYKHIQGLVYREPDSGIKIIPRTKFLNSLDLSFDKNLVDYYWCKSGMLNIQTKRGCPYNCIYCSYPVIEGSKVRTLEISHIIDTLKELYFKQGITYVFFTDSVFNISNDFNIKLAQEIIKSGVKVNWGAYFTPHNLTREALLLYKQSGLTHIEFGTESFSDQQLKNYRKHFLFKDVLEVSEICSDLGIFFAHFLILCGYGETERSLDETFENSKKIPLSVFFPYIGMRIYPYTELFNIAVFEGLIKDTNDLLEPVYYVSKSVNTDSLKMRAQATGKKWIFPDFDDHGMIERFRQHNKRGPLWEYLRY